MTGFKFKIVSGFLFSYNNYIFQMLQVITDDKLLYGDSIVTIDPVVSYSYIIHDNVLVCINCNVLYLKQNI